MGGWGGGRLTFPGSGGVGGQPRHPANCTEPAPQGSCPMWATLGEQWRVEMPEVGASSLFCLSDISENPSGRAVTCTFKGETEAQR